MLSLKSVIITTAVARAALSGNRTAVKQQNLQRDTLLIRHLGAYLENDEEIAKEVLSAYLEAKNAYNNEVAYAVWEMLELITD